MRARLALAAAAMLALAGCRAKEITKVQRDEAAVDASDAEFAVSIHDLPRAEDMLGKAVKLCPDDGNLWLRLGVVRIQMKNPDGARQAYKSALSAIIDTCKAHPSDSASVLRRAYVLAILGRPDEARSVVADAAARLPDDRRLQGFVEAKGVDKMLADPALKRISP